MGQGMTLGMGQGMTLGMGQREGMTLGMGQRGRPSEWVRTTLGMGQEAPKIAARLTPR
jgi:hypothetical protein